MPSGYTADISKGISFKEYALNCAKAFGANILMRDEPLGTPIKKYEPDDYYIKSLTEKIAEKSRFLKLSREEMIKLWNEEFSNELRDYDERLSEKLELKSKYETMLENAKKFIPPTKDHVNFKNFMIEQLESSIRFDCSTDYMTVPKKESFLIWRTRKIKSFNENINYYMKNYGEEVVRTDSRNDWNEKLFDSLKDM